MSEEMGMRLVFVEWEDSVGGSNTWTKLEEIYTETGVFWSIGWALVDDESRVVLVPHMTKPTDKEVVHGVGEMVIPRSAIRKIVDVAVPGYSG